MTTLRNGITFRRATREGRTPVEHWGTFVGYVQRSGNGWTALTADREAVTVGTDRNGRYATRADAANRLVGEQPERPMALRAVRVDEGLWQAAHRRATAEGTTVSEVIRSALATYAEREVKSHE